MNESNIYKIFLKSTEHATCIDYILRLMRYDKVVNGNYTVKTIFI